MWTMGIESKMMSGSGETQGMRMHTVPFWLVLLGALHFLVVSVKGQISCSSFHTVKINFVEVEVILFSFNLAFTFSFLDRLM